MKKALLFVFLGSVALSFAVATSTAEGKTCPTGSCSVKQSSCPKKERCRKKTRCAKKSRCKTRCKKRKSCKPRCPKVDRCAKKECGITCPPVGQEISGVLCKPVERTVVEYCPKEDRVEEYYVPCAPVVEEYCENVSVPTYEVVEGCKKVPVTRYRVEEYCEEVTVPTYDVVENCKEVPVTKYRVVNSPDKCCKRTVCCPPERIEKKCIMYEPIDLCTNANHTMADDQDDLSIEQGKIDSAE